MAPSHTLQIVARSRTSRNWNSEISISIIRIYYLIITSQPLSKSDSLRPENGHVALIDWVTDQLFMAILAQEEEAIY